MYRVGAGHRGAGGDLSQPVRLSHGYVAEACTPACAQGSKQLKLDPTIYDALQKEKVGGRWRRADKTAVPES